MQDEVWSTSQVVLKTKYRPTVDNPCYFGSEDSIPHTHSSKIAGRSSTTQGNFVTPTAYHRYDMSFRSIQIPEGEFMSLSGWKLCSKFGHNPRFTWYQTERTTDESTLGLQGLDYVLAGQVDGLWRPVVPSFHYNTALSRALDNARNDVADVGENLGELGQTVRSLSDNISTMARALAQARKKNWYGVRHVLGLKKSTFATTASNRWLEYNYGWKPLVSDIISGINDAGAAFGRGGTIVAKGKSSDVTVNNGFPCKRGFEVGLIYKINDATALGMASYGMSNPLVTSWQLMRYSFLIDWLLPVGDYLKALGGIKGTDFVAGYSTRYTKGKGGYTKTMFGVSGVSQGQTFAMYRQVLNYTPRPGIALTPKFSVTKALNALALLQQRR